MGRLASKRILPSSINYERSKTPSTLHFYMTMSAVKSGTVSKMATRCFSVSDIGLDCFRQAVGVMDGAGSGCCGSCSAAGVGLDRTWAVEAIICFCCCCSVSC